MFPKTTEIIVCKWCGRKLSVEYFWKCNICGETYCFIHRDKHNHV